MNKAGDSRTYGQFCSMARALDLVGDRWTLLIVRELLTQGSCRYSDLRSGLPGIATNLLASRLREMESNGLVARHKLPAPVSATVIELTSRGRDLTGVVLELTRWGAPEMRHYSGSEEFRSHWLMIPARHFLTDHMPESNDQTIRIGMPPDALDVVAQSGVITIGIADPRSAPHASINGPPPVLVGVVTGGLSLEAGQRVGLSLTGDEVAARRVLPVDDVEV